MPKRRFDILLALAGVFGLHGMACAQGDLADGVDLSRQVSGIEAVDPEEQVSVLLNLDLRRDLLYANDRAPHHRLSLLLPRTRSVEGALPLVIWIDGGGWTGGDHAARLDRVVPLVRTGRFAAASIGYRPSAEAAWPAQIHDCKAAIRWLRANAEEFGLDPDRFALMGSGAGAHLATLVGTTPGIEMIRGRVGRHLDVEEHVHCVIDFGGPTDFLQMDEHMHEASDLTHDAPGSMEVRLVGGDFAQQAGRVRLANPLNFVPIGTNPDFLIIHGMDDLVVPFHQSLLLKEALEDRGDEVVLVTVTNGREDLEGPIFDELVMRYLEERLHGVGEPLEDFEITLEGQRPLRPQGARPGGGTRPPRGAPDGDGRTTEGERPSRMEQLLQRYDRDGDGQVTEGEMPRGREYRGAFERFDENGDGGLDLEEFTRLIEESGSRTERGGGRPERPEGS